jgi:predicted amidohydrolase YtcJ
VARGPARKPSKTAKRTSGRSATRARPSAGADLIFHSGKVYRVDPRRSWAEAVAIKDGKIVRVGSDRAIQKLRGKETRLVDLGGRMMMPGLVDVHNHHTRGGQLDMFELAFPSSLSFDGILARVRASAAKIAQTEWISGGIWSSELVGRLSQPSARAELDAASLGRPVMLRDDSLHNRWVNSKALELMAVTAETPDPVDGEIVRDGDTGEAVGLLVEKASALAERALLQSIENPAGREIASTRRAVEILNSYGVTAYQDANTTLPMLRALKALDRKGQLNAWCVGSLLAFDTLTGTEVYGEALIAKRHQFRSAHVRPDFVKLFMDGVPMTRTAAMLDPYKGRRARARGGLPFLPSYPRGGALDQPRGGAWAGGQGPLRRRCGGEGYSRRHRNRARFSRSGAGAPYCPCKLYRSRRHSPLQAAQCRGRSLSGDLVPLRDHCGEQCGDR